MAVVREAFVRAVPWGTSISADERSLSVEDIAQLRVGEVRLVSGILMRRSAGREGCGRSATSGASWKNILISARDLEKKVGEWLLVGRRKGSRLVECSLLRRRAVKATDGVMGMQGRKEEEEGEEVDRNRRTGFMSTGAKRNARMRLVASATAMSTRRGEEEEVVEGENKDAKVEARTRVNVLAEALPYMQRFRGKTIVVKYGGAAMKDETLKAGVIKDLVLLTCIGVRPVLVHGGGPEINQWLKKLGIKSEFRKGLRVTDEATMEVVEMVLVGKVNKSIVSLINKAGGSGMGMCGKDAGLITARALDESLGFVGEVASLDTAVLTELVEDGRIPVVASVAADLSGQAYNINADAVAGELAASLKAEKLILMTDVPGVMRDSNDVGTLIKEVDAEQARSLMAEGVVSGGMIPKVECCIRALSKGVKKAHIIDGRAPHSLLMELLTDQGAGTMISQ